jgi:Ras-related protein Rab-6A
MHRPNLTVSSLNVSKGAIPPLIRYKIVILGDQGVGKSSIINRFIHDIFDPNDNRPTIGIDFISQNIYLEEKVIRLQLWDTAGQ